MASIVGHSLGALAAWEIGRRSSSTWIPREPRWYVVPCVIAVVPDLDVLVSSVAHRGASHSLLSAFVLAAVSCAVIAFLNRSVNVAKVFAVTFLCATVHPLLDYLMACGPKVPFFWPLSERGWLSPIQLVPTAYYARSASGLIKIVFYPETWAGIALETLSLGSLWLALRSRATPRQATFAALSVAGFLAIWFLYNLS